MHGLAQRQPRVEAWAGRCPAGPPAPPRRPSGHPRGSHSDTARPAAPCQEEERGWLLCSCSGPARRYHPSSLKPDGVAPAIHAPEAGFLGFSTSSTVQGYPTFLRLENAGAPVSALEEQS